jgi:formylglycine-generating enzyme required for sulfatase activity
MSRGISTSLLAAPLLIALACGEPFLAVDETTATAGAADDTALSSAGVLGLGGRPAVINKPALGGTSAGGNNGGVPAGAGAVDSAGAPGAAGAPSVVGAGACPTLLGEKLIQANGFCIDENEVTAAHYQEFVASHPSLADQPAACAGNTTFANACKTTSPAKEPVSCVDWCDAHAYCKSVGKRLCGTANTVGGAMPYDAPVTAPDNQWYAACSHDGERVYPYGDQYDSSACWSGDRPPSGAVTVKTASGCVGGYEGLSDMSGGLAEWVDSCSAEKGMADACHIRGGSFSGTAEQLRCDWESGTPRSTTSNYIGFRCCAELVP